jgi:hypothetical protein
MAIRCESSSLIASSTPCIRPGGTTFQRRSSRRTPRGGHIYVGPYLSQLRSWHRSHPSQATIEALGIFFRVAPRYFTDDECFNDLDKELDFLAHMRDQALQRIASRIVGLSSKAQHDVAGKSGAAAPCGTPRRALTPPTGGLGDGRRYRGLTASRSGARGNVISQHERITAMSAHAEEADFVLLALQAPVAWRFTLRCPRCVTQPT